MVKTRRRNYTNVTFDDEDDVREMSSNASDDSGGSDDAAPKVDEDFVDSSPSAAPPDSLASPTPSSSQEEEKEEEEEEEQQQSRRNEEKNRHHHSDGADLPPPPPPLAPISPRRLLQRLVDLDVAATKALAVSATPDAPLGCLRPFFKLVEFSCHGVPWLLFAVTMLLIGPESSLLAHAHLLALLVVDLTIVGVSKAIFHRNRPAINVEDDVLTVSVDKYSFPSGHATRATILLLHLCVDVFATHAAYQTAVVAWALCVVVSRVIIGRHHVLDVAAGCLVGALVFLRLAPLLAPASAALAGFAAGVNQRRWVIGNLPDCLVGEYV